MLHQSCGARSVQHSTAMHPTAPKKKLSDLSMRYIFHLNHKVGAVLPEKNRLPGDVVDVL